MNNKFIRPAASFTAASLIMLTAALPVFAKSLFAAKAYDIRPAESVLRDWEILLVMRRWIQRM